MQIGVSAYESLAETPRLKIAEALLTILAVLIIWLAFTGHIGVFLGATIAPGGMVEH